jgi:hypothetical protein
MTQRILTPAAAVIGLAATAMAGAAISLLLTAPTDVGAAVSRGDVIPFLESVLTVIADVVWGVLQYL